MFGCGMPAFIKDSRACFSLSYEEMVYFMAKATLLKSVEVPIFSLIFLALNRYAKTCQQNCKIPSPPLVLFICLETLEQRGLFIYEGDFLRIISLTKSKHIFLGQIKTGFLKNPGSVYMQSLHVSTRVVDFFPVKWQRNKSQGFKWDGGILSKKAPGATTEEAEWNSKLLIEQLDMKHVLCCSVFPFLADLCVIFCANLKNTTFTFFCCFALKFQPPRFFLNIILRRNNKRR